MQHQDFSYADCFPQVGPSDPPIPITRKDDLMYCNCTLGTTTCPRTAMVLAPVPENRSQQFQDQDPCTARGPLISPLVDFCGDKEGMCVPRAPTHNNNIRCEPLQLGSPSSLPSGPGPMVSGGPNKQHKLAGAEGSPPGPPTLPGRHDRPTCVDLNGQCGHESTHKPRRGHSLQITHGQDREAGELGGETYALAQSRTHLGLNQYPSGLVQLDKIYQ